MPCMLEQRSHCCSENEVHLLPPEAYPHLFDKKEEEEPTICSLPSHIVSPLSLCSLLGPNLFNSSVDVGKER